MYILACNLDGRARNSCGTNLEEKKKMYLEDSIYFAKGQIENK